MSEHTIPTHCKCGNNGGGDCDFCLMERNQSECDHGDMEGAICLDCGKDRTEEYMADAYDRAKDARKYGDV